MPFSKVWRQKKKKKKKKEKRKKKKKKQMTFSSPVGIQELWGHRYLQLQMTWVDCGQSSDNSNVPLKPKLIIITFSFKF